MSHNNLNTAPLHNLINPYLICLQAEPHTYNDESNSLILALHHDQDLYLTASNTSSKFIVFMLNFIAFRCSQISHTTAANNEIVSVGNETCLFIIKTS